MNADAPAPDAGVGMSELPRLPEGNLRLERLMGAELHEGQVLNRVRVELAPGVVEPAHVHPGVEGVAGRGSVERDPPPTVS